MVAAVVRSSLLYYVAPADYAIALAFIGLLCEVVLFVFNMVKMGNPSAVNCIPNPHHTTPIIVSHTATARLRFTIITVLLFLANTRLSIERCASVARWTSSWGLEPIIYR